MITNETIDKILAFDDEFLAQSYSTWSERNYCAGWLMDGEEEFAHYLLEGDFFEVKRSLEDYEEVGVAKIRKLLQKAKSQNEKTS